MNATDAVIYIGLPYVALFVFFLGTIYRYRAQAFSYSSLASQTLENRHHFWALVPFHYGIIVVLAGHIVAFLVPRSILAWNARPLRLYILEASALVFAILALVGLVGIIVRRATEPKVRVVTTPADWIVYGLLLIQVVTGIGIAVFLPWGSSWFASIASPYLWSLATFQPEIFAMAALPWFAQLHVINAFVLIAFFPFSRLVHILVVPNHYLWRKRQVVRWYGHTRPASPRS